MTVDLRLGDCLEVMRGLPSESIDMVFADPPFNLGKKYGGKSKNDKRVDYYAWCDSWIVESFRLLKPTGTIYLMTIARHLGTIYPMLHSRGVFVNQVNWRNVSASHSKRGYWASTQPILVYGKTADYVFNTYAQVREIEKKNLRWGGYSTEPKGQLLDYWDDITFVYAGSIHHPEAILREGTNAKIHPCQMPIGLAERAILFSTNEGATILEPFAGVAGTAIACLKTGRNYIGSEREQEYYQVAQRRIAEAQAQLQLAL